jgi:hypothetical protein
LFPVKAAGKEADEKADPNFDLPPGEEPADEPPPQAPSGRVPEVGRDLKKSPEELCAGIPVDELYVCEGEGSCGKGSPTPDECVWCGATFDAEGNIHLPPKQDDKPKGRSRTPKKPAEPAAPAEKPKASFRPGF